MLKCHLEKDVFYIQIGNGKVDHGYWYPPEFINYPYPAYKVDKEHPGSEVAGEAAATFSASILFKDEDPFYSQTLLEHAKDIYNFADKYRGNYTTSVPEVALFYGTQPNGFFDELEWAALWLFRARGDEVYLEKFETLVADDKAYKSCDRPISWDEKYAGVYILSAQILKEDKYLDKSHKYADLVLNKSRTPGVLYFYPGLSR